MARSDMHPISFTYMPVASMRVVTLHSLFLYSDPALPCHRPSYWLGLFLSNTFSCINTPTFSNLVILHTYLPMKMGQTECSEMSAYKIQMPGNYPEESIEQKVWNQEFFCHLLEQIGVGDKNPSVQFSNSLVENGTKCQFLRSDQPHIFPTLLILSVHIFLAKKEQNVTAVYAMLHYFFIAILLVCNFRPHCWKFVSAFQSPIQTIKFFSLWPCGTTDNLVL